MNCVICDKPAPVKCNLCSTPYCSAACQKLDWDQRGHKTTCLKIVFGKVGHYAFFLAKLPRSPQPVTSLLQALNGDIFKALTARALGLPVNSTNLWKRYKEARRKIPKSLRKSLAPSEPNTEQCIGMYEAVWTELGIKSYTLEVPATKRSINELMTKISKECVGDMTKTRIKLRFGNSALLCQDEAERAQHGDNVIVFEAMLTLLSALEGCTTN